MNRKENFQLLSKLNILKGYLIEININGNEVLKTSNSLFEKEYMNDINKEIEGENFIAALNLLNNRILNISNLMFKNPCDKSWYDLIITNENNIKFCLNCSKNVYLVSNEEDFIKRRNLQQCVALNTHYFQPNEKNEKNFKSCRIKFYDEPLLGLPF
jgi:hypothetical protein